MPLLNKIEGQPSIKKNGELSTCLVEDGHFGFETHVEMLSQSFGVGNKH